MSIMRSRTISVGVARDPQSVYDFITDPRKLPQWAPGFANSMHESAGDWLVETTVGPVRIEFVERNELGVADHRVTIKPGVEVLNPVRVIANGDGSDVTFTLFRAPGDVDDTAGEIA